MNSKIVPVLDHHTMKAYFWSRSVSVCVFLTLALDGGEWSASCTIHFISRERTLSVLSTHYIGGWLEPTGLSGHWRRKKTLSPARNQGMIPHSACCLVTILTELSQLWAS
jgi:hypothetical protein